MTALPAPAAPFPRRVHHEVADDPATLAYPPTFPLEIALKTAPLPDICRAYGIDRATWDHLKTSARFLADLRAAQALVAEEGMSFRVKARLQAEELLKTSWKLIHAPSDEVPSSVKADLIKFTIRAAGYDESAKKDTGTGQGPTFNLQINMG